MIFMKADCLNLLKLTTDEVEDIFQSFDNFLFDCDGVLWLEGNPIDGSVQVINRLRELGKRIFFITNYSRATRAGIAQKANQLGFTAYENEVLCPSFLAVNYLRQVGFNKKVYVVAREAIVEELNKAGIRCMDIGPDIVQDFASIADSEIDPDVGCVLIGLDEHFSYKKMVKASTYLRNPNCIFLATNPDEVYPSNNNLLYPGAGCIIKSIEACTGRKAFFLGKPSNYICELIDKTFELNAAKTIMIGDRGNTDIIFGHRNGFKTMLVMSGVTSHEELCQWQESENEDDWKQLPHYYVPKLGSILPFLK